MMQDTGLLNCRSLQTSIVGRLVMAVTWVAALAGHDKLLKAGDETQSLKGHSEAVWNVAFSPDGKQLAFSPNGDLIATGSSDKTLKFWNIAAGL